MSGHITIRPAEGTYVIRAGSIELGRTSRALELKEGSYPPVIYVPRADIAMDRLERTDRTSTCPWKGAASYFSVRTDDGTLANAVWSYEAPKAGVEAIAGHLAFYPDKVNVSRQ